MSEENLEIVRRVYEAATHRDTATVLALYDPEVVWDASRVPWGDRTGSVCHGLAELQTFLRDWYEVWEDYEDDLEEVVDTGEHVVSVATGRGRGRASGVEVGTQGAGVWTIREGKVIRVVWFRTREEALEAAGLPD
jgi:ketosteroid isomerase-like protein